MLETFLLYLIEYINKNYSNKCIQIVVMKNVCAFVIFGNNFYWNTIHGNTSKTNMYNRCVQFGTPSVLKCTLVHYQKFRVTKWLKPIIYLELIKFHFIHKSNTRINLSFSRHIFIRYSQGMRTLYTQLKLDSDIKGNTRMNYDISSSDLQ